MKVYAAFLGDSEDCRLIGVFSSREKAEAIGVDAPDVFDVEEHELDGLDGSAFVTTWATSIHLQDGKIIHYASSARRLRRINDPYDIEAFGDMVYVYSPISVDHAAEVAIQEREKRLRS